MFGPLRTVRGWSRRRRRLALCGALVAAAIVTATPFGVLVVFAAFVLALDVLIPVPGGTWSEADDRFAALLRRRRLGRARLEVVDVGAGWAATAEHRARGIEAIAVATIDATVEAQKARTFDGAFRPARAEGEHWKRLWLAQARGAEMPPISVYRVGERHVVRDGHHRVSVARDLGLTTIDAEVVELVPQGRSVPVPPPSASRSTRGHPGANRI